MLYGYVTMHGQQNTKKKEFRTLYIKT